MPYTQDLRPGKFVQVDGKPDLIGFVSPEYNGTLNPFAASLNNTNQFKVFEFRAGSHQSLNETLINQDNYDSTRNNQDVQQAMKRQYRLTNLDQWDLLPDAYKINFRRPPAPEIHPT